MTCLIRNTALGVYIPIRYMGINQTQFVKICDALTTTIVKRLGSREMSREVRKYYRIEEMEQKSKDGTILVKYLVVSRFCGAIDHILAQNPKFAYKWRNIIGMGLEMQAFAGKDKKYARACSAGVVLNENQTVVVNHVHKHIYTDAAIERGTAGCIIVLPTGAGKSYVGAYLSMCFRRKTLIILPNTNNLTEWKELFARWYPDIVLGEITGRRKVDGDIVIMMFDTLLRAKPFVFKNKGDKTEVVVGFEEYLLRFGMVIYDEVHNYASAERINGFWRINTPIVLGLTATPDERLDGLDIAYRMHVGPLVISEKLPKYNVKMVKWTGIVHVIKYAGHPDYTKEKLSSLGYMSAGATNQQVTEDPARQYLVVKLILDLVRRDRDMFIFCEQIRQIDSLLELIRSDEFADDFTDIIITKLVGGQKEATNILAKCGQVIVVSFSFGSESISIPRKNTIVFYTSRKSKNNQKLGRILRLGGDSSICREIYDIVDVSTGLKKQFSERKKEYVKKGFPMMIHNMTHEDVCWPPERDPILMKSKAAKSQKGLAATDRSDDHIEACDSDLSDESDDSPPAKAAAKSKNQSSKSNKTNKSSKASNSTTDLLDPCFEYLDTSF